jgi:hypothetical protein
MHCWSLCSRWRYLFEDVITAHGLIVNTRLPALHFTHTAKVASLSVLQ